MQICVFVCGCVYACMGVCLYVCGYVCVCGCAFLYIALHSYTYTPISTNVSNLTDGLDFFYAQRQDARKLVEFLQSMVPCR